MNVMLFNGRIIRQTIDEEELMNAFWIKYKCGQSVVDVECCYQWGGQSVVDVECCYQWGGQSVVDANKSSYSKRRVECYPLQSSNCGHSPSSFCLSSLNKYLRTSRWRISAYELCGVSMFMLAHTFSRRFCLNITRIKVSHSRVPQNRISNANTCIK